MPNLLSRGTKKRFLLVVFCSLLLLVCAGTQVLATSVSDVVDQVSLTQYTSYLNESLYTHDGHNRGIGGAEHDKARDNIQNAFLEFGLTTSLDPFTYENSTYYNVVGLKTGVINPTSYYIVGAHYDSVDNPGADDDASGVAAVMEAARVLSQYQFAYSLLFIAFDREEQWVIGSTAYANAHADDNILGMVQLDMIAYNPNGDNKAWLFGTDPPNSVMIGLEDALETYGGIDSYFGGVMDYSDHVPFKSKGIDVALLSEYEIMHNPYLHKAKDSVDTPDYIDYVYATNMTRGTVGWLADSATLVAYAYDFTCTYGNGDYYSGTVYAAPEYGYDEGFKLTFRDENRKKGYYEITAKTPIIDGAPGQVFVDTYYDEESDNFYTPLHAGTAVGDAYLSSERDYILYNGMVLNRFGIGPEGSEEVHYEADVTWIQVWANHFPGRFQSIFLRVLYDYYLFNPAYPFDDDV